MRQEQQQRPCYTDDIHEHPVFRRLVDDMRDGPANEDYDRDMRYVLRELREEEANGCDTE